MLVLRNARVETGNGRSFRTKIITFAVTCSIAFDTMLYFEFRTSSGFPFVGSHHLMVCRRIEVRSRF